MTEASHSAGELRPDVCYVTATRRLAHHLRARHDAACVARGLRSWRTPEVRTWESLLRERFEADRMAGRVVARWLDDAHATVLWEAIVRRDRDLDDVLVPAGLGAEAARSWHLLHEYAIPLDALATDPSPEVQAFARWASAYTRRVEQGNWFDPARAATVVSPPAAGTRLVLVGFERLTPVQQACVRRFESAGVVVEMQPAAASGESNVAVVDCRDFTAELEAAARWAAQQLQARPQSRVAVIVPGLRQQRDKVRQAFDRVYTPGALFSGGPAPESHGYELAAARPLADRPVVAAALAWLEALGLRAGFAEASALLRGACDGAAAEEAVPRAELDAELRRYESGSCGLPRIARLAATRGCPRTADLLERALRRSRAWGTSRPPSAWATEFSTALRELGWPGAAADSTEHQTVQRWQALLGEFGSADEVAGTWSCATALGQLRQRCVDDAFEPQEIAAPLLVIDPETCAGMRFEAAWVCGLDAARWPGPASPEPFLPRDWQVRQRIPWASAEACAETARAVFLRLTRCADTVVCSVPKFEDEAPLLPSTLLAGLPRIALDDLDLWREAHPAAALLAKRPTLETLVDGTLPPIASHQLAKGGARLLELQAACPFRAAVEFRLGGRQLDEPASGIAATERGSIAHAVLQAFWEDVRSQKALLAMPVATRQERVRALVEAALSEQRTAADAVRLRLLELEQRWLEQRVLELIEQDAARPSFEIEELEGAHHIEVGGVQVRVKLDRVDRLADGSLAIIDYKTGRNARPSAWMRDRPEQPQLPLYVRAFGADKVKALAFGVVRKGGTGYAGYVRDPGLFAPLQAFDASRKPFKEYTSWDDLTGAWQRRLDALGTEHAQGQAFLAPNPREACRYCHLPGLCRINRANADDTGEEGAEGEP